MNSGGGTYSYKNGVWTSLGGGASGITAALDGSIYVLSNGGSGADKAIWHNANGAWSQSPGSGFSLAASPDTRSYSNPAGTVGESGLYVLNSLGSIYYENTGGSVLQIPGGASSIAPTAFGGMYVLTFPTNANGNSIYYCNLNTPGWTSQGGAGVSIATDSTHLYVVGASGGIYCRITPTGTITEFPIPTVGERPNEIAGGPDGNLWITEVDHTRAQPDKIGKVTTAGVIMEYNVPAGGAHAQAIVAGPDGNIWFTEDSANNIAKISTAGVVTEYKVPTANAYMQGIAVGHDGNLWFTEFQGNKIGRVATSGVMTEYAVPTANAYPSPIASGPDNNIWFGESGKIGQVGIPAP